MLYRDDLRPAMLDEMPLAGRYRSNNCTRIYVYIVLTMQTIQNKYVLGDCLIIDELNNQP